MVLINVGGAKNRDSFRVRPKPFLRPPGFIYASSPTVTSQPTHIRMLLTPVTNALLRTKKSLCHCCIPCAVLHQVLTAW